MIDDSEVEATFSIKETNIRSIGSIFKRIRFDYLHTVHYWYALPNRLVHKTIQYNLHFRFSKLSNAW